MELLTTPASHSPFRVFMLPTHTSLDSVGLTVLILKGEILLPSTVRVPLNFNLQLQANYFRIPTPRDRQ